MKNIKLILLFFLTFLILSGCVVVGDFPGKWENWHSATGSEERNKSYIENLSLGTNSKYIIEHLGNADFSESFQKDDKNILVLFYRTHRTHHDGDTTKDECTPLIFEDKLLTAWGETSYEAIR